MPPLKDRDYSASQYYAIIFGEQLRLKPRRQRRPTPDETTLPQILADLKDLTGFEPPAGTAADTTEPVSEEEIIDGSPEDDGQ